MLYVILFQPPRLKIGCVCCGTRASDYGCEFLYFSVSWSPSGGAISSISYQPDGSHKHCFLCWWLKQTQLSPASSLEWLGVGIAASSGRSHSSKFYLIQSSGCIIHCLQTVSSWARQDVSGICFAPLQGWALQGHGFEYQSQWSMLWRGGCTGHVRPGA